MQSSSSYTNNPPGISTSQRHPSTASPVSSYNADSSSRNSLKRRRIDRACDLCRRRKTKCDGPKMSDNICSNCIQSRKACTYLEASKPRGPPKAYVTGLEDRLERMEAILKQLRPDQDFSDELGPSVIRDSWKDLEARPSSREDSASNSRSHSRIGQASSSNVSNSRSPHRSPLYSGTPLPVSSHLAISFDESSSRSKPRHRRSRQDQHLIGKSDEESASSEYSYSSDTDDLIDDFENGMRRLTLHTHGPQPDEPHARFHGQTSSMKLIDATRKYKQQHLMETTEYVGGSGESSSSATNSSPSPAASLNSMRRPQFWRSCRWELVYEGLHVDSPELLDSVLKRFPPEDLAEHLIELYFRHINPYFPLLHRPTFEKQWKEGLQNDNIWFACVSASMFAVASRWSDDPRVLPREAYKPGTDLLDWSLSGWNFFLIGLDIHRARRSLLYPATLFEVQTFTLLAMYLRGTVDEPVGWTFVSIGIRKAQDVGAHRKTVYSKDLSADDELWKRAFWLLVAFDRVGSASLGRACGTYEEDFDLDFPLDVDDEYWNMSDPAAAFQQPPGVPSKISAFILWIKLTQIIAFILRTLYALGPSKLFLERLPMPDSEAIVKQLDDVMSEWMNSVPDHLKWSRKIDDPVLFNQAAMLYTTFYWAQMLVHRPFISCPRRTPSELKSNGRISLHSSALPICSHAAKSCARIIEAQMQRAICSVPNLINAAHVSAGILIINLWELKVKEKLQLTNPLEDIKPLYVQPIESLRGDIDILMSALEWAEPRFSNLTGWLQQLRKSLPGADIDRRPSASDILGDSTQYSARGRLPFSLPGSSRQALETQNPWQWEVPSLHFPSSSSWDSTLHPPIENHTFSRTIPLSTSSHSVPTTDRIQHELYHRDCDPVSLRHEAPNMYPNLQRATSFWPSPELSSSSFPASAGNSYSELRSHNASERGLPFISSLRRSSSNSLRSLHLPEGSEASHTGQSRPSHTVYRGQSIPDMRDVYQQQLPTSDTRSTPTAYDRRDVRSAEWERYHFPDVNFLRESNDRASWDHSQSYAESAPSHNRRMQY